MKDILKITTAEVKEINVEDSQYLGAYDGREDIISVNLAHVKTDEEKAIVILHEECHRRLDHFNRIITEAKEKLNIDIDLDKIGPDGEIELDLDSSLSLLMLKDEHEMEAKFCEHNLRHMMTLWNPEEYLKTIEAPDHILNTINSIWRDIQALDKW